MLIKNKHRKPPGTKITLDLDEYEFKTNDAGDDVCEVEYPEHIDIFLNKTGGAFEPYGLQAQAELRKKIADEEAAVKAAEAKEAEARAKAANEAAEAAKQAAETKLKSDAEKRANIDAQTAKELQALEEAKKKYAADKSAARKRA